MHENIKKHLFRNREQMQRLRRTITSKKKPQNPLGDNGIPRFLTIILTMNGSGSETGDLLKLGSFQIH